MQLGMPAGEEARARAFYAGALGMTEVPKPAELAARGGAWFASGSLQLHLGVDPAFIAAKKAHPALRCSAFDELVQKLERSGYAVTHAGAFEDGARHAYVEDPFGNRIELVGAGAPTGFMGLDHVDLRVRNLARARPLYDALLPALGLTVVVDAASEGEGVVEWYEADGAGPSCRFFGIRGSFRHVPNDVRIAFSVASRERVDQLAALVRGNGAQVIEGPQNAYDYEPYYAVFFEDVEGNKLEICHRPGGATFPP